MAPPAFDSQERSIVTMNGRLQMFSSINAIKITTSSTTTTKTKTTTTTNKKISTTTKTIITMTSTTIFSKI